MNKETYYLGDPISVVVIRSLLKIPLNEYDLSFVGNSETTWYYVGITASTELIREFSSISGGDTTLRSIAYYLVSLQRSPLRKFNEKADTIADLVRHDYMVHLLDCIVDCI